MTMECKTFMLTAIPINVTFMVVVILINVKV